MAIIIINLIQIYYKNLANIKIHNVENDNLQYAYGT